MTSHQTDTNRVNFHWDLKITTAVLRRQIPGVTVGTRDIREKWCDFIFSRDMGNER